jgi:chromosome partitioning protein
MKIIAFFNNKGGVGKTSLVYHLAWLFADLGKNVIAADLDPQANLTSMFLKDDRLEELWPDDGHNETILGAVKPIISGTGDINTPHIETLEDNLSILVGDLGLSVFEDKLAESWLKCYGGDEASLRCTSSFYRILLNCAEQKNADLVLVDVGPNLGAINRSAIIAADYIVTPLAPDLFSLQGLKNLGPTLFEWRKKWRDTILPAAASQKYDFKLPLGNMQPIGYIIMQHAIRLDRPTKSYQRWIERIPSVYQEFVLKELPEQDNNGHELATIKHYRSLMGMAMEAHKPIFKLSSADGVIGSHMNAVQNCYQDFKNLANKIEEVT